METQSSMSITQQDIARIGEFNVTVAFLYLTQEDNIIDGWAAFSRPHLEQTLGVEIGRWDYDRVRERLKERYPGYEEMRDSRRGSPILARIK